MKILLCLGLLLVSLAPAQELEKRKHMRFIPLGELPVWKEKIENGKRIQIPPKPGDLPPNPTVLAEDAKDGFPMNLRLKLFTDIFSVKPAAGGVKIYEGKAIGGNPWIASGFHAKNHSLGILYRDNNNMTWLNPKMMTVPDNLASFPLGTARFVNVSPYTAIVKVGNEQAQAVRPGGILIKKLKVGDTPMLLGYFESGTSKPQEIFKNNFVLRPKQRIQAFFYKAQGKNPRKAVKLFYKPEFFVAPPKPKKAAAVAGG